MQMSSNSLDSMGAQAKRVFLAVAAIAGMWVGAGCGKKVVVPDLVRQDQGPGHGLPLDQAIPTLAAASLKVGKMTGTQGPGAYVTQQSPLAGQQVEANSLVDLTVETPVSVPPLVGSNITDAVSTLQAVGLRVAFLSKKTLNPFAKPKVEGQNPPPNTLAPRDSVVTLNVSGPADVDALMTAVAKEAAYKNLNPKYKSFLDLFLADPNTSRSMEPEDAAPAPSTPNAPKQ